jgi:hypothetical protein
MRNSTQEVSCGRRGPSVICAPLSAPFVLLVSNEGFACSNGHRVRKEKEQSECTICPVSV